MDFTADGLSGDAGTAALASEAELEGYGRAISQELDAAEAELNAPRSRPFGGLGAGVMGDVQRLRTEQFDMFKHHVQIEQQYRVASPIAEPHVRRMGFSSIADTMRSKESATASLLNRLADFDNDLRQVIASVEGTPMRKGDEPARSADGLGRSPTRTERRTEAERLRAAAEGQRGSMRRRSGGVGPA